MSDGREYPSVPRVGVGAVVLDADRVLLVRRGKPPLAGKWSLPQVLQARQYSDAVSGESRTCATVFLTPLNPTSIMKMAPRNP